MPRSTIDAINKDTIMEKSQLNINHGQHPEQVAADIKEIASPVVDERILTGWDTPLGYFSADRWHGEADEDHTPVFSLRSTLEERQ